MIEPDDIDPLAQQVNAAYDESEFMLSAKFAAALLDHPAQDRMRELVVMGARVHSRPCGNGIFEISVTASDGETYSVILDRTADPT